MPPPSPEPRRTGLTVEKSEPETPVESGNCPNENNRLTGLKNHVWRANLG